MDRIFAENQFILKRKGLSIAGKYLLFDAQGKEPLLFIEEKSKWIPPSITYHAYADEKKTREVLTLKDRPDDPTEDMDVFDAQSGEKIGSLVSDSDSFSELFKDVWTIIDAEGKTQGKVFEKSLSKSLMRELVTHDLPQQMDIKVGEIEVGELRQKVKPISYELVIDLSKDVSGLIDHRMAVAAAILMAYHQGKETD
jgi:hypothetical protein